MKRNLTAARPVMWRTPSASPRTSWRGPTRLTAGTALAGMGALVGVAAIGMGVPSIAASYGLLKLGWVSAACIAAAFGARNLRTATFMLFAALAFPFTTKVLGGVPIRTTEVLLLIVAAHLVLNPGSRLPRSSPPRDLYLPMVAICVGGLVAALAGPLLSGSLTRLVFGLVPACLAGVATVVVLRSERDITTLVAIAALALAATSVLALAQAAGLAPGALASQFGTSRVNGLLEHPNDLGAFISVMMLILIGVLACARTKVRFAPVMVGAIAVGLPALASTLSRGALVGLAIGLAVELVTLTLRGRAMALIAMVATLAGVTAAILPSIPVAQRDAYAQRFAQLANPATEIGRTLIYNEAERVIRQYPLTGVGPLAFGSLIAKRTQVPLRSDQLGHAHNLVLEALLSIGPIGLAGLCVLVGRAMLLLYRATRKRSQEHSVLAGWSVGVLAAIVAILAQSVTDFLFHQVEMLTLFSMLLGSAFAAARMTTEDRPSD